MGAKKLSTSDILTIEKKVREGYKRKDIAKDYGISLETVGRIFRGEARVSREEGKDYEANCEADLQEQAARVYAEKERMDLLGIVPEMPAWLAPPKPTFDEIWGAYEAKKAAKQETVPELSEEEKAAKDAERKRIRALEIAHTEKMRAEKQAAIAEAGGIENWSKGFQKVYGKVEEEKEGIRNS